MTVSVIIMIIIGFTLIFASYFVSESLAKKKEHFTSDLLAVRDDYEFSEREMGIIKSKIEDVIADQAKDILYETNEALANMANEKTLALGDYAVTVCDEIERNHKEVMFLYSMLDDKQKEIMKTVKVVDKTTQDFKDVVKNMQVVYHEKEDNVLEFTDSGKESANDQLTALKQMKARMDTTNEENKKSEVLSVKNADIEKQQGESVMSDSNILRMPDMHSRSSANEVGNDESISSGYEDVFEEINQTDLEDAFEDEFEMTSNSNDIILEMHRNGESIIDIARELGLGVGEVKLVIDLYQGV